MIKKTIKFTDLDGKERTEEHYFHIFLADAALMKDEMEGNLGEFLKTAAASGDTWLILEEFEKIISKAYGIRTEEGTFELSPDGWKKFRRGQAYDVLFTELISSPDALAEFIVGLLPKDTSENPEFKKVVSDTKKELRKIQDSMRPVENVELPEELPPAASSPELGSLSDEELEAELRRRQQAG